MERFPDIEPSRWERARRIWVTELNACPRKRQYRLNEEITPHPSHFDSLRGSIAHGVIEQVLKGEEPEPDYSEMPEAEIELSLEVSHKIDNLHKWLDQTDIDLSEAELEKKLVMPIRDGYLLVGTIDCLTPTHIIDFKTGQKRNTKPYRMQLAAYNKMLSIIDGAEREMLDVFLGSDEPEELYPFESTRTPYDPAIRDVEKSIDDRINITARILQGYSVPATPGFLCVYCGYINNPCRGI
jgi:hypothetical protein